jgi:hypothetical protein
VGTAWAMPDKPNNEISKMRIIIPYFERSSINIEW